MSDANLSRRAWLRRAASAASSLLFFGRAGEAGEPSSNERSQVAGCTLGFSTYGLPKLSTEEAIETVARIGFDAIEVNVAASADAAPDRMTPARRRAARRQLANSPLLLTSLMEHLVPQENDRDHALQLARLEAVLQLAGDLSGGSPPLVQTVLGGGVWEKQKALLRDRLGVWLELAERYQTRIAIKPHRGGCVSRPEEAVWLIEQLGNSAWLRMVYDYSHYAFRDMPLDDTIATALPCTAHVAVKDAVEIAGKVVFKLPGEAGTIDFASLIRQFHRGGYRGDFNCEVSGQVWSLPDYNPTVSAQRCHDALALAFEKAETPRRRKQS